MTASVTMNNAAGIKLTLSLVLPFSWYFRYDRDICFIERTYLSFIWLQIGSPYLSYANELINLANQMGIIDEMLQRSSPNASKCLTMTAVEENNISQNRKRVLEMKDIYGILTVLSIGLGLALLVFTFECIAYKIYSKKCMQRYRNRQKRGP